MQRTTRETLGGRTLERPSCGGFVPTAETTLIPASGYQSMCPKKVVDEQRAIRQRSQSNQSFTNQQMDRPCRSEAIRRLIEFALAPKPKNRSGN
jgi:hypothetical protein